MKWIAKSYTKMQYTECDWLMNYAKKNNMAFRGHTLVWPKQTPPDFIRWETDTNKIQQWTKKYVQDTVRHFSSYTYAWDVINEAVSDKKD